MQTHEKNSAYTQFDAQIHLRKSEPVRSASAGSVLYQVSVIPSKPPILDESAGTFLGWRYARGRQKKTPDEHDNNNNRQAKKSKTHSKLYKIEFSVIYVYTYRAYDNIRSTDIFRK